MMSMPPGPPPLPHDGVPPDDELDDARDLDRRPDEVDEETAAAEALGYTEPEDAPIDTEEDRGREAGSP